MTAITVFNGEYCDAEAVVGKLVDITGYQLVTDQDIIADAASMSGLDEGLFTRAFTSGDVISADGMPIRDELVSWLRFATAKRLAGSENQIFWGYTALLPPMGIDHILRVCLIAEMDDRIVAAAQDGRLSEASALDKIIADDQARGEWTIAVTDCNDPWGDDLYDVVIPVDSIGTERSACFIVEQLANDAVQESDDSLSAVQDFLLGSHIQAELAGQGHAVAVSAHDQTLKIRITDHARMLKEETRILSESVSRMDGVKSVEIGVGRRYNPGDIYQLAGMPTITTSRRVGGGAEFANGYDLEMASMIQSSLEKDGHDISVFARNGSVSLTINAHKKILERVSRDICEYASVREGVQNVEIGIGREYHQAEAYAAMRRKKVRMLLAEANREFNRTLSPRLRRDAEEAHYTLSDRHGLIRDNEADVIILDMPQSDAEALRRVKEEHPESEVLVLTDPEAKDKEAYRRMGVFASIPKPVNAAKLNATIQAASRKKRTYLFS